MFAISFSRSHFDRSLDMENLHDKVDLVSPKYFLCQLQGEKKSKCTGSYGAKIFKTELNCQITMEIVRISTVTIDSTANRYYQVIGKKNPFNSMCLDNLV